MSFASVSLRRQCRYVPCQDLPENKSGTQAAVRQIATRSVMDLTLPNLGEGADSGTVVNLFVKEGDQLTVDQPVLELENEKAVATIPSTAAGRIAKVYVKSGDKLTVGQKILSLTESKEAAPAKAAKVEPGS